MIVSDFINQLSKKLGDSGNVRYSRKELKFYLDQALYTFGATSLYWKERDILATKADKYFYNLEEDLDNKLLKRNLTNQWVLDAINYDLLENLSDTNSTSELFSVEEILRNIRDRVILFLLETNLTLNYKILPLLPNTNTILLDSNIIDITRLAFRDTDGKYYLIRQEDENNLTSFYNAFDITSDVPIYYTSILQTNNFIKLIPNPNVSGVLELLYLGLEDADLTLESEIGVPDNLVSYIKYGVELDLLSKGGIANDSTRAAYCKQRWDEGIFIGKVYTSALNLEVNGRSKIPSTLEDFDNFESGWQNKTGVFDSIAVAGYNYLVINKVPTAEEQIQSIVIDLVTNAKIPKSEGHTIEISDEYLSDLLNYTYHLVCFKSGAYKIAETQDYYEQFIKNSINFNTRMIQQGLSYKDMIKFTKKQEIQNPRMIEQEAVYGK